MTHRSCRHRSSGTRMPRRKRSRPVRRQMRSGQDPVSAGRHAGGVKRTRSTLAKPPTVSSDGSASDGCSRDGFYPLMEMAQLRFEEAHPTGPRPKSAQKPIARPCMSSRFPVVVARRKSTCINLAILMTSWFSLFICRPSTWRCHWLKLNDQSRSDPSVDSSPLR